jgi:hypothetical protein
MTRLLPTLIAAVCVLTACAPKAEVHWRDANFKIYATPSDYKATKLGYDHRPGLLGLVAPEVVAAGSTAQWVFVERLDRASGRAEFFIVPKEGMPENHSGTVEGPFSETQFRELRAARQLPEFTWRKKK